MKKAALSRFCRVVQTDLLYRITLGAEADQATYRRLKERGKIGLNGRGWKKEKEEKSLRKGPPKEKPDSG